MTGGSRWCITRCAVPLRPRSQRSIELTWPSSDSTRFPALLQTGIGTYTTPQVSTAVGRAVSKTLDEMVAWNLDAHVMSTFSADLPLVSIETDSNCTGGYEFLMQNCASPILFFSAQGPR